jgi:hypothetical protein
VRVAPQMIHADIGPTRKWGHPTDASRDWAAYHRDVWERPGAADADLFLIDGRFRVACVMQVVLRADPSAVIAVHDYADRAQYHVIGEVAREIARQSTLSLFVARPSARPRARAILSTFNRIPE